MAAYYNEIDPYAAQWLRNLIAAGLVPTGDVDGRSIADVRAADLRGYVQCHFFAGLGGWPRALRLAGWPDDRAVWTGSCPCQPFSAAGARKGFADDRHLWPAWCGLIRECAPSVVFGEQIARATDWLALVRSELEAMGYAVGCLPMEAASVGAPHLRDRFWFVADSQGGGPRCDGIGQASQGQPSDPSAILAYANGCGWPPGDGHISSAGYGRSAPAGGGDVSDSHGSELREQPGRGSGKDWPGAPVVGNDGPGGWWAVEPDVGRVAHGIPSRVAKLRAFGNAIVPQLAAEFIGAAMSHAFTSAQRVGK